MAVVAPPEPDGVSSYQALSEQLRALRAWAGLSYREVHRRVVHARRARGVVDLPAYSTVYRCLQPGRARMDVELVVDVAAALLGDDRLAARWRQACRRIEGLVSAATVVTVLDGLPDDLDAFTGREAELAQLLSVIGTGPDRTVVISAIDGMAGVGKTRLAVHAAHALVAAGRFTDGCLSVNLRGYDPNRPPADPAAVLDGFLRRLGVAGSRVAGWSLARRSAEFRQLMAGRRALVLLDNAASADQVRPLLPGSPSCLVLVTGRRQLDGIRAARLTLDVFSRDESLALLRRGVGSERVDADPDSAAGIAALVGHLPLALALLASRISASPDWTLADHLEGLAERHAGLRLDDGMATALGVSYDSLDPAGRRLLRLLALHPGRDFDAFAAAALAGTGLAAAEQRLAGLVAANLLQQRVAGRCELHDLVRVFATDRARDEEPASARGAALTSLFDHYRYLALTATNSFAPAERYRQPELADPGTPRPELADHASAARWLDTERANLIAIAIHADANGWPGHTGHLSQILFRYLELAGHLEDSMILHSMASRAADQQTRARALSSLGVTLINLGRHRDSRDRLDQSVAACQACGDRAGERIARMNLGSVELYLGHYPVARQQFQLAIDTARTTGDRVVEGRALRNIGLVHQLLGDYPAAIDAYQAARDLAADTGDRVVECAALIHTGSTYVRLRQYRQAIDQLTTGLAVARELRHRMAEADGLDQLGTVYTGMGSPQDALRHHQQALTIAAEDGSRQLEVQILNSMGPALCQLGQTDRALRQHRRALAAASSMGDRYEQARAHDGIARCLTNNGGTGGTGGTGNAEHAAGARTHWQRALALHTELGTPEAAGIADRLRAFEHQTAPGKPDLPGSGR